MSSCMVHWLSPDRADRYDVGALFVSCAHGFHTPIDRPMSSPQLKICSFESRRSAEIGTLIEKMGGEAFVAPSMQEVPLSENSDALAFAEKIFAGEVDLVVFMTGVGTRQLFEVVETKWPLADFFEALQKSQIISRGPKPVAVLKKEKIRIDHTAPEPNTWRDILPILDEFYELEGKTVAVQEYGIPNEEFYQELANRHAVIERVPVYQWAFPDDPEPLHEAIRKTVAGQFDVLAFTSANQANHVLQAAEQLELKQEWIEAANRHVIASIGPTASEYLTSLGLPPDLEASPPKLGPFVRSIMAEAPGIIETKQPQT